MEREPNDEQLLIEGGDEDVEVEEDEFVNEEEAENIEEDGPDDPDPPDNGNRIDLRPFTEAVIPGAKCPTSSPWRRSQDPSGRSGPLH